MADGAILWLLYCTVVIRSLKVLPTIRRPCQQIPNNGQERSEKSQVMNGNTCSCHDIL